MLRVWCSQVRKGFGSYVEAEVDRHGELVAVHPRRTATGEIKVVKPQMIIGYLLEMASGSVDTPKGGHAGDLLARAGQEAVTACGPRSKMKFKKGAYGSGTCADEPWSLQAYQKRVYAVRACRAAAAREKLKFRGLAIMWGTTWPAEAEIEEKHRRAQLALRAATAREKLTF